MTENALKSYAQAQGINANISAMSEQEKVALRYNFVLQQLSLAQGDFAKTSDSWANQVRIMQLRFESFKATMGQGLINVFLPVIKVINAVIAKLQVFASYFSAITGALFGKAQKGTTKTSNAMGTTPKGLSTSLNNAGKSASSASKGLKKASKATKATGTAAKKAKKEIKGLIGGLDEINNLTSNETKGSDGVNKLPSSNPSIPSSGGIDIGDLGSLGDGLISSEIGNINSELENMDKKLAALSKTVKRFKDLFLKGFKKAFKNNKAQLDKHVKGIKESLKDIFEDSGVQKAIKNYADKITYNFGKIAGSLASIGATYVENLLGGIDLYLKQNKDFIKESIISIFDINSDIVKITGDYIEALADIFEVFRSPKAKQITSDFIAIFSNATIGALELATKFGRDILNVITQPLIDNQEKIKKVFGQLFEGIEPILGGVSDLIKNTFKTLNDVYDEYISPGIKNIANGFSELGGYILDTLVETFPVIGDIGNIFRDIIVPALQGAVDDALKGMGRSFYGITEIFNGVIQAVVGFGTGDWSKAWQGVVNVVSGIWDGLTGILKIAGIDLPDSKEIGATITKWWESAKKIAGELTLKVVTTIENISSKVQKAFAVAQDWIGQQLLKAKTSVESFASKVSDAFAIAKKWIGQQTLKAKTNVESFTSKVSTRISDAKKWLKGKTLEVGTKVGSFYSKVQKSFNDTKARIKKWAFTIGLKVNTSANNVKNTINGIIRQINSAVFAKIKITVPNWVPVFGGKTWGPPKGIPYLAKGGMVDSATLAMIGEAGKEVVLPLENNTGALDLIANRLVSRMNFGGIAGGLAFAGAGNSGITRNDLENIGPFNFNISIGGQHLRNVTVDTLRQLKRQGIAI